MKEVAVQAEKIICDLDKSQDQLEEMAFELLNAVDHVRTHNVEMYSMLEVIVNAESVKEEEVQEAIQGLIVTVGRIARAMNKLEGLVHKNEEVCAEQRKSVEEAKQVVDFLRFTHDWD